jgi:uncharacterized protein (TIGR00255 family)
LNAFGVGAGFMRSMTGFGVGESTVGTAQVSVEIRSVNHRYCDVRVRLAPEFAEHAFYVEQLARQQLGRGRFDVNVRVHGSEQDTPAIAVERLRQVFSSVCALRDELDPNSPVPLASLLAAPGIFVSLDPNRDREVRQAISESMAWAIKALDTMREREGTCLRELLKTHVRRATELVQTCSGKSSHMADIYRMKLRERLYRLLSETSAHLDETRLEQEVALLADRTDATEELSRLLSHLAHFDSYLDASDPVGRRLDFLLQEIAREANTLGAKCQDSGLSLLVVELKAEAERMREQVQNVE